MFQHHCQPLRVKPHKTIIVIQNGTPNKHFNFQFQTLNKKDLEKAIESHWNIKTNNIKFFSSEGVQYDNDDLRYVKDKENIYISRGQQFDLKKNLGQYELLETLGQGGFGHVSLGRNRKTKELVAVKVLKPSRLKSSQDIDMIFKEAENMKSLKHPNIVKIIHCSSINRLQMMVVMQYMKGGDLLGYLKKKKKFSQDEAKMFFRQIIGAVAYCHRRGIIHRDLKLDNILLANEIHTQQQEQSKNCSLENSSRSTPTKKRIFNGCPLKVIKISDFGISGVSDRYNAEIDTGTLKYMAPEILAKKEKSNTPAVDVWACGIILYYMLNGCLPFDKLPQHELITKIISGQFKYKEQNISETCKNLIEKMLIVDPKKRIKVWEIQQHQWLTKNNFKYLESDKVISDVNRSDQYIPDNTSFHETEERDPSELRCKENRKSIIILDRISQGNYKPVIPKRLEKQRRQIDQQLQDYRYRRDERKEKHTFVKAKPRIPKSCKKMGIRQNQHYLIRDSSLCNGMQGKKKTFCLQNKNLA